MDVSIFSFANPGAFSVFFVTLTGISFVAPSLLVIFNTVFFPACPFFAFITA